MALNGHKNQNPRGERNEPPDLDEIFKKLQAKMRNIFRRGKSANMERSKKTGESKIYVFVISAILIVLWLLSGIFIVNPAEQAAILRFGKYIETVGPGPHWIPTLIETKIIRNVERVLDYSYSAQMLTKDENLVSVSLAVQYRIGDLEAYLFNVSDPQESLRQATSSALRQVVGTTTLDQIITEGREAWGMNVRESLNKILVCYKTGIVIVNVSPQPARAPQNVQEAFDDAIKAQEDEKRFKEQAFAYKAQVVPIAQGNANRIIQEAKAYSEKVVLTAQGDVAEFSALLPQYQQAPLVTAERMYINTIQEVLSQSTKIILEGKAGNVLYLPLDKLGITADPLEKSEASIKLSQRQDKQLLKDNLPQMVIRGITRPTYQ